MCIILVYISEPGERPPLCSLFFLSSDFPVAVDNLFVFYVPRYKHYKLIYIT